MAKFNAQGIEGLELSLEEFTQIPDDVVENMLTAAGEVVVAAHKRKIDTLGLVDSGKLKGSIKALSKAGGAKNGWRRHVVVYPTGNHGKRRRKKVRKFGYESKNRQGRWYEVGGDVKPVTNNDVGFVHEFGAPKKGIPAKQWMRRANEECAPDVERAEFEIYDKFLKSKDL